MFHVHEHEVGAGVCTQFDQLHTGQAEEHADRDATLGEDRLERIAVPDIDEAHLGVRSDDRLHFGEVARHPVPRCFFPAGDGSSIRQISLSFPTGQRVWKRHPGGGLRGLGTSPSRRIRDRRRWILGLGVGTAESRACV